MIFEMTDLGQSGIISQTRPTSASARAEARFQDSTLAVSLNAALELATFTIGQEQTLVFGITSPLWSASGVTGACYLVVLGVRCQKIKLFKDLIEEPSLLSPYSW